MLALLVDCITCLVELLLIGVLMKGKLKLQGIYYRFSYVNGFVIKKKTSGVSLKFTKNTKDMGYWAPIRVYDPVRQGKNVAQIRCWALVFGFGRSI